MRHLMATILLAAANLTPSIAQTPNEPSVTHTARVTRLECVGPDVVELEVSSDELFPVRNALTELAVGPLVSSLSRYPDGGGLYTLIFTITRDELNSVSSDDEAVVRYNPSNGHDVWLIGSIDPSTAQGCTDVP